MADKKGNVSSSRKHTLKSCMLALAKDWLEAEALEKVKERERYMAENCPPLEMSHSKDDLMELCKKLYDKINVIDEERYNLEYKVIMVCNEVIVLLERVFVAEFVFEIHCSTEGYRDEVLDLNIKIVDLRGKFKKPALKKVRMSADAMLQALLGSKHKVTMDLRSNLKQVKKDEKKEDKELRDVGDWRKNIDDKAGMDGRKKMFQGDN